MCNMYIVVLTLILECVVADHIDDRTDDVAGVSRNPCSQFHLSIKNLDFTVFKETVSGGLFVFS